MNRMIKKTIVWLLECDPMHIFWLHHVQPIFVSVNRESVCERLMKFWTLLTCYL